MTRPGLSAVELNHVDPALPSGRLTLATIVAAAIVFLLFFAYYAINTQHLPLGAGPDYVHNDDAAQFIYDNRRLAVLPDDEDALKFTAYGGTRALRPPLSFITAAYVASLFDSDNAKTNRKNFRLGASLLSALAVTFCFLALAVYFGSLVFAISGALLMGLMPQIAFIGSYNNDDASAIMAGSIMLLALVVLLRRGVGMGSLLLFGFAAGVCIISKQSAWIIAPSVMAFLVFFVARHIPRAAGAALAAIVVCFAVGGWWTAFNVYHYGWDDPLAQKITKETASKHSRFPADKSLGYAAQGVDAKALLLDNYDDFMTKTVRSTVGNLDWLRLQVGPNHYRFYVALFVLGLGIWFLRLCTLALPDNQVGARDVAFEGVLVFALLCQFAAYVYINLNNDIQTQGKYLLPVIGAALILVFAAIRFIVRLIASIFRVLEREPITLNQSIASGIVVAAIAALGVGLHYDALVSHVLPYYRPSFYDEPLHRLRVETFRPLSLASDMIQINQQVEDVEYTKPNSLSFRATGADPWFVLKRPACAGANGNTLIRVTLTSSAPGHFAVYWDDGDGFSESNSTTMQYRAGTRRLFLWIGPRNCQRLRIDPGTTAGTYVIKNLAIAGVDVSRPRER